MTVIARPIQAFDLGVGDAIVLPTAFGDECLVTVSQLIRVSTNEVYVEFADANDVKGAPESMTVTFEMPLRIEERFCAYPSCDRHAAGSSSTCEWHLI